MADSYSLKVMSLFEAGARLGCSSETACLAAAIYHKFFTVVEEIWKYDLYMFALASIKLAHMFYELEVTNDKLSISMMSIIHGNNFYLEPKIKEKLGHSIDFAARIICHNLHFEVDFKDNKRRTPGDIATEKKKEESLKTLMAEMAQESDEDLETETVEERLLINNPKTSISSHRYLSHYMKTIKLLVEKEHIHAFEQVCNVAWAILADFHWSPSVTKYYNDHIACTCLMMSIEVCMESIKSRALKDLLKKKWNLIFCDDLNNTHLEAVKTSIVRQYAEYERVIAHEFNTYVIDPTKDLAV